MSTTSIDASTVSKRRGGSQRVGSEKPKAHKSGSAAVEHPKPTAAHLEERHQARAHAHSSQPGGGRQHRGDDAGHQLATAQRAWLPGRNSQNEAGFLADQFESG